jgi:glycosyltransferase involved in cell wall biosynthesis
MSITLVNVTLPVFNEEVRLEGSVRRLVGFLSAHARFRWEIVIADNGSTDRTLELARRIAADWHPMLEPGDTLQPATANSSTIRVTHLDEPGRGRALKQAWSVSQAEVLSYMDVDLSTDLAYFPPLIEAVVSGGFDLAVGSRLLRPDLVTRGWKRETISRCYNWLVRWACNTRFSDAQCGFKAITRQTARELLPLVEDTAWFFDTELLVLAEKRGCRLFDLPVIWREDPDSRVRIGQTAWEDIKGLWRLWRRLRQRRPQPRKPNQNRE